MDNEEYDKTKFYAIMYHLGNDGLEIRWTKCFSDSQAGFDEIERCSKDNGSFPIREKRHNYRIVLRHNDAFILDHYIIDNMGA